MRKLKIFGAVGVDVSSGRTKLQYRLEKNLKGLCYTDTMQPDRAYWPEWAQTLQRWGLSEFVADILEAAGPLTIFLAQAVYLGQPFLRGALPGGRLQALSGIFEDQNVSRSFAHYLREDHST
jgi:hypothetical protein